MIINSQNPYITSTGSRNKKNIPAFKANFAITPEAREVLAKDLRKFNYNPDEVFSRLKDAMESITARVTGEMEIYYGKDHSNWWDQIKGKSLFVRFKGENKKMYEKTKEDKQPLVHFYEFLPNFNKSGVDRGRIDVLSLMGNLADLYAKEHGYENNPFHIIAYRMKNTAHPLTLFRNEEKIIADKKAKNAAQKAQKDVSPSIRKLWRKYSGLRAVSSD